MKSNVASLRYMLALLICLFLGSVLLNAQGYRATLDGRITDSTGGAVPAAAVTATNLATNIALKATTDSDGRWTILGVSPGTYDITVEAAGFKKHVREKVVVHVNDLLTFPIALEVGELQQSVTVSEETPLLTPESASMGAIVSNREVTEIPLNGRNVMMLMTLATGVTPNLSEVQFRGVQPYETGPPRMISVNGAPASANMFLLNGIWDKGGMDTSFNPSPDMVQEFKMQKNPYDAEYGHTAGGVVNVVTKSGTNEFHGTLYEFHRNSVLDANTFFANKVGSPKTPAHYNQFGGTIGGPVLLPHSYNGKDRTFWFFNYEGLRSITSGGIIQGTVPTDTQRAGDFSTTRTAGGQLVNIYDPTTVAPDPARPGKFLRSPFPGNRVPTDRMNPAALKILDYFPRPYTPGDALTGQLNFAASSAPPTGYNQVAARVDHNISEKSRIYTFVGVSAYQTDTAYPNQSSYSTGQNSRHAVIDYVRIVSPHTVMTANIGYQRKHQWSNPWTMGFDATTLGFPQALVSQFPYQCFPIVGISDMWSLGTGGPAYNVSEGVNINFMLTHIHGRHSMKMGTFFLLLREYDGKGTNSASAGNYAFDGTWTQVDPLLAAKGSGYGLASFLLGIPTSGTVARGGYVAVQRPYNEYFFQDDFKATSRLTLNLGLRWELEGGLTDRFDHMIRDFDVTTTLPQQAAAQANYALNPIPQVPVNQFLVRGGEVYAGANGASRAYNDLAYRNWGPRLGIAYRASNRMVWRAGSGVFYASRASGISQDGFNSTSSMVVSIDGIRPLRNLSNPFPDGLQLQALSAAKQIDSLIGWSLSPPNPKATIRRTYNWSTGFQYELPFHTVLETSYVGSRTGRYNPGWDYDAYDPKYLALGSELNRAVPNPFYGLIAPSTGRLGLPTVQLNQLLRPYPQYQGLSGVIMGAGNTVYHSLQMSLERRMAAGLSITGAYTLSKNMDRNTFLNPGWSNVYESVIDGNDSPQRLVIHYVWDMPFGRGKALGSAMNPVLDKLIGGWELSGIYVAQRNIAINGPSGAIATGQPAMLSSGQSIDNWFNKQAFAVQPPFTMRTLSTRIAQVRLPFVSNWDTAILKNFPLKERMKIQFRAELYNAFNHPIFGGLNLSLTDANFGRLLSQTNAPRQIQFGLKILY